MRERKITRKQSKQGLRNGRNGSGATTRTRQENDGTGANGNISRALKRKVRKNRY